MQKLIFCGALTLALACSSDPGTAGLVDAGHGSDSAANSGDAKGGDADGASTAADVGADASALDAVADTGADAGADGVAAADAATQSGLDAAGDVTSAGVSDAIADSVAGVDAAVADGPALDAAVADAPPMDMQMPSPDAAAEAKVYDIDPNLDVGLLPAPDALPLPASPTNIDVAGVQYTCKATWVAKPCAEPVLLDPAKLPGLHVDLPNPITYADKPPSSGPHRPVWGNWGEYAFLPQQRWLHNLEHSGFALLYNPCAPKATVEALRAFAKVLPPFGDGPPIWVLTPYPELPSAIAMVTWGHVYLAECVQPAKMLKWAYEKSGDAPEVESMPGGYSELWLGGYP